MRVFSLMQLSAAIVVFGIYFYFIDPLLADIFWLKLFVFVVFLFTLSYFYKWLEGRFEIVDKRLDKQLSVWIVFFNIVILLIIGTLN